MNIEVSVAECDERGMWSCAIGRTCEGPRSAGELYYHLEPTRLPKHRTLVPCCKACGERVIDAMRKIVALDPEVRGAVQRAANRAAEEQYASGSLRNAARAWLELVEKA